MSDGLAILAVRLGAMGDIIHTLPAIATLRNSFPRAHISWLVERRWTPLLAGNPCLDEVLTLDRGSSAGIWRSLQRLRARRYDLAIDFQGLIKSAIAARASGAPRRIGYHRSQAREPIATLLYSHQVTATQTHIIDRHLELAQAAGAQNLGKEFPLPPGRPEGSLPTGPFVLASPLAGWPAKQWPLERYAELARMLPMPLVLNVPHTMPGIPNVQFHVSSLDGLIDATRRASAVVGVDSGPLHLAGALNKPGVAIFGPTDPARNGPPGANMTLLRSAAARTSYKRLQEIDPAMAAISADQVFEALRERLA